MLAVWQAHLQTEQVLCDRGHLISAIAVEAKSLFKISLSRSIARCAPPCFIKPLPHDSVTSVSSECGFDFPFLSLYSALNRISKNGEFGIYVKDGGWGTYEDNDLR